MGMLTCCSTSSAERPGHCAAMFRVIVRKCRGSLPRGYAVESGYPGNPDNRHDAVAMTNGAPVIQREIYNV